jgi:hypothetical protein
LAQCNNPSAGVCCGDLNADGRTAVSCDTTCGVDQDECDGSYNNPNDPNSVPCPEDKRRYVNVRPVRALGCWASPSLMVLSGWTPPGRTVCAEELDLAFSSGQYKESTVTVRLSRKSN